MGIKIQILDPRSGPSEIDVAHSDRCGNARKPQCKCSGCGGTQHGWPGKLAMAREPTRENRDSLRHDADIRWRSTTADLTAGRTTQQAASRKLRRASADRSVADVVDYLAQATTKADRVAQLGALASKEILNGLVNSSARKTDPDSTKIRRNTTGHFWCSLFSEISGAANRVERGSEQIPEDAKNALCTEEGHTKWNEVQRSLVTVALTTMWGYMRPLILQWDLEGLIQATRILALLICPSPGLHPRIVRICAFPLGRELLTEDGMLRIMTVFDLDVPASGADAA